MNEFFSTYSVRLNQRYDTTLNDLSAIIGVTRSELIRRWIDQEAERRQKQLNKFRQLKQAPAEERDLVPAG